MTETVKNGAVLGTAPNQELLDLGTTTITIAGKEWPVPLFAPKQNVLIVPRVMTLSKQFELSAKEAKKNGTIPDYSNALDDTHYRMLADCAFFALTRAHKTITREEFDNWPIPTYELIVAFPIIANQTGVLKFGEPGKTGEAGAANSPTGKK